MATWTSWNLTRGARRVLPWLLGLCVTAALLLTTVVTSPLDHDEHQFVASAALWSRQALLPYLDYPYFHMPNLIFVYGGLFRWVDHLLLAGRSLDALACLLLICLFSGLTYRLLDQVESTTRLKLSFVVPALLLLSPHFSRTSGRAWNHGLAVLLCTVAALIFIHEFRTGYRTIVIFFCGVLLGIAIGIRLSFAVAPAAFFAHLVIDRPDSSPWWPLRKGLTLTAGILVGLAPPIYLLVRAPEAFMFGNFTYANLNTLYFQDRLPSIRLTLPGKFLYLIVMLLWAGNSVIAASFAYFAVYRCLCRSGERVLHWREIVFCSLWAAAMVIGAWLPTPSHLQYYFSVLPPLLLAVVYSLASLQTSDLRLLFPHRRVLYLAAAICLIPAVAEYRKVLSLIRPGNWVPLAIHQEGLEVARLTGARRILTLSPIVPLEGRGAIYRELATGPFSFRVSGFVESQTRASMKMPDRKNLESWLRGQAPAAVFTGLERDHDLEQPLIDYARRYDYQRYDLTSGRTLWIAPHH